MSEHPNPNLETDHLSSCPWQDGHLMVSGAFWCCLTLLLRPATCKGRCWEAGRTWLDCCAPLGDGDNICFKEDSIHEHCCWSSPELEPMSTDLFSCANDPALRRQYFRVAHAQLGLRKDCSSLIACRAFPTGWVAVWGEEAEDLDLDTPTCEHGPVSPGLNFDNRMELCAMLPPLAPEAWYDADGLERAQLRYRFGKAQRSHCAVPNWLYLREEPLRLYSLIRARSKVLPRILINIGAGDADSDDPLGRILQEFAGAGPPWKGIYFEAMPDNCVRARSKLAETGAIHLQCGYTTPDHVSQARQACF